MNYYDRFQLAKLEVGQSKDITFGLAGQSTIRDGVTAFHKHNPERRIKTKPLYEKNLRVGTVVIRIQ